jgi:myosin-5
LLINYANEKLQAHFTSAAITLLQAEYEREGLAIQKVEHTDNTPTILLLEGRPLSVLALLDDQCLQAGATDTSLVTALHASFGEHPSYATPRFGAAASFTIKHFGGDVTYHSAGFLSKNKDALFAELPACMRASTSNFVVGLFSDAAEARRNKPPPGAAAAGGRPARRPPGGIGGRGRATQFVSVGSQFRDSIASLVATLGATQSHFVRCIKPNEVSGSN